MNSPNQSINKSRRLFIALTLDMGLKEKPRVVWSAITLDLTRLDLFLKEYLKC